MNSTTPSLHLETLPAQCARLTAAIQKLRAGAKGLSSLKPLQNQIDALPDDASLAALTDCVKQINAATAGLTASQSAADESLYNANASVRTAADVVGGLSRLGTGERGAERPARRLEGTAEGRAHLFLYV